MSMAGTVLRSMAGMAYQSFLYYYREKERAIAQAGMPIIQPQKGAEQARFTGGGFNLKQQSAKA